MTAKNPRNSFQVYGFGNLEEIPEKWLKTVSASASPSSERKHWSRDCQPVFDIRYQRDPSLRSVRQEGSFQAVLEQVGKTFEQVGTDFLGVVDVDLNRCGMERGRP